MGPPALSSKIKGLRFMQRAAETIKREQETNEALVRDQATGGNASKDAVNQEKKAESWAEEASKTTCVILRNASQSTLTHGKLKFGSKKADPVDVVDEQVQAVERDLKRMAEDDPPKSATTHNGTKKKKRRR